MEEQQQSKIEKEITKLLSSHEDINDPSLKVWGQSPAKTYRRQYVVEKQLPFSSATPRQIEQAQDAVSANRTFSTQYVDMNIAEDPNVNVTFLAPIFVKTSVRPRNRRLDQMTLLQLLKWDVEKDDFVYMQRGALGRRWEEKYGAWFSCAYFPTVLIQMDKSVIVRPYVVCYSSFKPSEAQCLHIPKWEKFDFDWDDHGGHMYIDTALMGDLDMRKSVASAINLTMPSNRQSGNNRKVFPYLWISPADEATLLANVDMFAYADVTTHFPLPSRERWAEGIVGQSVDQLNTKQKMKLGSMFKLSGASLGLATIAALQNFPRICYTGYVHRLKADEIDFAPKHRKLPEYGSGARARTEFTQERLEKIDVAAIADVEQFFADPHSKKVRMMRDPTIRGHKSHDSRFFGRRRQVVSTRGSDIIETVEMLPFKCAWSFATGMPLVIPHTSDMEQPLSAILESDWFRNKKYLVSLTPNAYSMVQAFEGIPYVECDTTILIAVTATEACQLAAIAYNYIGFRQPEDFSRNASMRSKLQEDFESEIYNKTVPQSKKTRGIKSEMKPGKRSPLRKEYLLWPEKKERRERGKRRREEEEVESIDVPLSPPGVVEEYSSDDENFARQEEEEAQHRISDFLIRHSQLRGKEGRALRPPTGFPKYEGQRFSTRY